MKPIVMIGILILLCGKIEAELQADITVVNEFTAPGLVTPQGADIQPYSTNLSVVDINENVLRLFDLDDGTYNGYVTLDPTLIQPRGFAYGSVVNGYLAVNDYQTDLIHYRSYGIWYTFDNPGSNIPSGMDMEGYSTIWEARCHSTTLAYIWSFDLDGTNVQSFIVDQHFTVGMLGLTVFSFGSESYIMYTCSSDHTFYFYSTDGTYQGSEPAPASITYSISYGLTYCEDRDTFYLVTVSSPAHPVIYELDFDFSEVGLDHTTWGLIKASF